MELKGKTCMSHKPDWVTEEELWREPVSILREDSIKNE